MWYCFFGRGGLDNSKQGSLVLHTNRGQPVPSPSSLGFSTASNCPSDATIARVVEAMSAAKTSIALDNLVKFRVAVTLDKPLETLLPSAAMGKTRQSESGVPLTECSGSHHSSWCIKGSLYRELLFLSITALAPDFDLGMYRVFVVAQFFQLHQCPFGGVRCFSIVVYKWVCISLKFGPFMCGCIYCCTIYVFINRLCVSIYRSTNLIFVKPKKTRCRYSP